MPGYVSHKAYVAQDGERLTLFERQSAETLRSLQSTRATTARRFTCPF